MTASACGKDLGPTTRCPEPMGHEEPCWQLAARAARAGQGEAVAAVCLHSSWYVEGDESSSGYWACELCGKAEDAASTTAQDAEGGEVERLRADLRELADDFASNVDWSAGRNNYGDNEAWESAAARLRAVLDRDTPNGGGE